MPPAKKPKYVNAYTDRHGQERLYFRRGGKKIPLPSPIGSDEFLSAYKAAMEGKPAPLKPPKPEVAAQSTVAGSFGALIVDYYKSSMFAGLAPVTQEAYRRFMDRLRKAFGTYSVAGLTPEIIDKVILAPVVKKSPSQAHIMRKRLIMLLDLAVRNKYRPDNPARYSSKIKYKAKGWPPWTEEDIAMYRAYWTPETPQRKAVEFLLNTGLRRGDVLKLSPKHRVGDRHVVKLQKSGETVEVNIPIHNALRPYLEDADPKQPYIRTVRGVARSDKAFTNWIIEAAREAGLPPGRSPHGLRKAMVRRLTDMKCTPQQISAITGQSLKTIEIYIKGFDKASAADSAMASIMGM